MGGATGRAVALGNGPQVSMRSEAPGSWFNTPERTSASTAARGRLNKSMCITNVGSSGLATAMCQYVYGQKRTSPGSASRTMASFLNRSNSPGARRSRGQLCPLRLPVATPCCAKYSSGHSR